MSTVEDPDGIDGLPGDSEWVGQIRVPFAVESLLSGVQMPLPLSEDLDTSDEREVELLECNEQFKAMHHWIYFRLPRPHAFYMHSENPSFSFTLDYRHACHLRNALSVSPFTYFYVHLCIVNINKAGNTFAVRRVALWYRRRFNLPVGDTAALHPDVFVARHRRSSALRYFLNFEAVDYDATVMNGVTTMHLLRMEIAHFLLFGL